MGLDTLSIYVISAFVVLISVWIGLSILGAVDRLYRSLRSLELEVMSQRRLLVTLRATALLRSDQTGIGTSWKNTAT